MRVITFISTTILASAVAVALGMLFAPHKGSKTRRKLSKKKDEYAEYLSDNFDSLVDSASHAFENAENETERLATKASGKMNKVVGKVNSK